MKNPDKDGCWPENVLCLSTATRSSRLQFIPKLGGAGEHLMPQQKCTPGHKHQP